MVRTSFHFLGHPNAHAPLNVASTYGFQKFEDLIVSRKTVTTKVMSEEYNRIKGKKNGS